MTGISTILRCVVLFSNILLVSVTTFSPGCSFFNDQCIYTVQLGHERQCNKADSPSQTDVTCCQNVTDMYNVLKNQLDSLQKKVEFLESKSQGTNTNSGVSQYALDELKDLKAQLKATKENLRQEKENAAHEIQDLHERLINSTTSLHMCQAAIGINTSRNDFDFGTGNHTVFYCSFDEDRCDFEITSNNRYVSFDIISTPFASGSAGPTVDHTKGVSGGKVLGLNATFTAANSVTSRGSTKTGKARTKPFPPSSSYCIMFWYFMPGKDTKELFVNLEINGGAGYPIYRLSGRQSDNWELAKIDVDFEYTSHSFRVMFTATRMAYRTYMRSGDYKYNDKGTSIAIDDLYIFNTTCNNIPEYPSKSIKYDNNVTTSFYTFHTKPLSWSEAYDVCRQEGPHSALVSIESVEEQNFLVNTIHNDKTLSRIGLSGFYTSGTDVDKEHFFIWTDTGIPKQVLSGQWHSGQPNNVGGNQDCLLMQYSSDNYSWGDVDCKTKHPFICEVYKST